MKDFTRKQHFVDSFASLMLFVFFALFLMLLLLFCAEASRDAVDGLEENNNLHTAAVYITTKFRRYDTPDRIALSELDGLPSLRFSEEINGQEYYTFLYLKDGELKELFTQAGSQADSGMGTPIAALDCFSADLTQDGFYRIALTDSQGQETSFYLHPGAPSVSAPVVQPE